MKNTLFIRFPFLILFCMVSVCWVIFWQTTIHHTHILLHTWICAFKFVFHYFPDEFILFVHLPLSEVNKWKSNISPEFCYAFGKIVIICNNISANINPQTTSESTKKSMKQPLATVFLPNSFIPLEESSQRTQSVVTYALLHPT